MKALKNVRLELHRVSQFDAALQLPNLARGTRSRPAVHVCALGSSVFTRVMTELAVLAQRRQAIREQYMSLLKVSLRQRSCEHLADYRTACPCDDILNSTFRVTIITTLSCASDETDPARTSRRHMRTAYKILIVKPEERMLAHTMRTILTKQIIRV
jgi:hypothetical protein